ncbi:F0F1 ATP synthase subunit A [Fuchsiella alkaliacetigena]|uniref:F0F1 ATP synthase subunit A n=1 Tax=Fuchsiella alkaliacetigena TaxID=957042 RepID=UPI00200A3310|nr:F0F1 ATP synthase subunit A [Fuchsiella alkaliacetigena]MCK8824586.1 F0F1 ATP synthase subunit A [Fuchsiella alkaliacetigena]
MGEGAQVVFHLFGIPVSETIVVTWVIMLALWIFAIFATRNPKTVPKGAQNVAELIIEAIIDLIESMMPNQGKKFLSFICTIALLIGVSNLVGIIPFVNNPTADLNTTMGIALIVLLVSNYYGLEENGFEHIKGFAEPTVLMMPINIIGELAKPVSLSFRLFGNVAGGGIAITIAAMFAPWIIPVPLMAWFDIFVGIIQAFIFTMLSIAYIAVARG